MFGQYADFLNQTGRQSSRGGGPFGPFQAATSPSPAPSGSPPPVPGPLGAPVGTPGPIPGPGPMGGGMGTPLAAATSSQPGQFAPVPYNPSALPRGLPAESAPPSFTFPGTMGSNLMSGMFGRGGIYG